MRRADTGRKPKVLMYYTYSSRIGGPLTNIKSIMASPLREKYDFAACYQEMAPGGVNMALLRRMRDIIRAEKPDIVHIHGAQSEGLYGVLAARWAGGCRTVMTVHGFAHDDSHYRGVKRFLYRRIIEPLSLRLSDCVYCVCRCTAERSIVRRNARKRSAGYIHNCVPALRYREEREAVRARYGIRPSEVVLCITARVTLDKGFDVLMEMMSLLRDRGLTGFRLMVIGDGEYMPVVRARMAKETDAGQVVLIGQTDRVADYLRASDVFVFPSRHENLSIALLEACAAGLPCIVSDVGGNGEIIRHGESGYLIPSFHAADYADAAQTLIRDAECRARMGAFARTDIEQRFSEDEMCRRLERVYADALEKEAGRR